MSKLKTFLNDNDGITMVDFLTIAMFLLYILLKLVHIILVIKFCENINLVAQFNNIFTDMNSMMQTVIYFYFGVKTVSYVGSGVTNYLSNKNTTSPITKTIPTTTDVNNQDV